MTDSSKSKPTLSPREIVERAEAHPAAVPFLWLGSEKVRRGFIVVPLVGTILFSLLGLIYPLHHKAPWDFFASYAVIGFVSYSFVVLSAWPLFKLLGRPENYYGEGDGDE
ncbi:MAG TPA: hypothetical protein ENK01_01900 [Hellea balneolensis]|uniref:Uncharacterized protein n=1 Tax=Hellea balneolensis TaxID=287478 RepID=A0A7V5NWQ5_9PROT|nr:hypothetical protein [Hellea balneolensis]